MAGTVVLLMKRYRDNSAQRNPRPLYRGTCIALWLILWLLVSAANAQARTLRVPADHSNIQDAVDASEPGDTILVEAGSYRLPSGNLYISHKSLTLRSTGGAQGAIIEGRGGNPVITLAAESRAVIDGFTITSMDKTENKAVKGGGIYCAPSSAPTIRNSIITGNRAVFGAGIFCAPWSSPVIKNNVISQNTAVRFGGGIFSLMASPEVTNNRIVKNEASNAGGGIFCTRDTPRITNNILWRNKAKSGGGVSCDRSYAGITNNTMSRNIATFGGGVFVEGGSIRIINNIFWANRDDLYAATFTASSRPDHSDIGDGDFEGVNGNISADPMFTDSGGGDFRLKPGSPCLDAGNPDPIFNDPDGSRNDMGAYGGPEASPSL
jgi:hypothetical protein